MYVQIDHRAFWVANDLEANISRVVRKYVSAYARCAALLLVKCLEYNAFRAGRRTFLKAV